MPSGPLLLMLDVSPRHLATESDFAHNAPPQTRKSRAAARSCSCGGGADAHPSGVVIAGITVINPIASHENDNGNFDSCYRNARQPLRYVMHGASYIAFTAEGPAAKRVIVTAG